MTTELNDFSVVVNLNGWFVRQAPTYYKGQEFSGDDITERMVQAIEGHETFRDRNNDMKVTPVLTLRGGKPEALRAAFKERSARKEVEQKLAAEAVSKEAQIQAEKDAKMKVKIEAEMKAKAEVEAEEAEEKEDKKALKRKPRQ